MKSENRQQKIRPNILMGRILIEQNYRNDADLTKRCQRYAKSAGTAKK